MPRKLQNTIQTLIRNWLKGDSIAKESLAQKAANNTDPFLKDAMDGYKSVKGNHLERLNNLDGRLQKRVGSKKKNRGVIFMQRVAAIAAILLMVFGSFWWFNNNFEEQDIVSDNVRTSEFSGISKEENVQARVEASTEAVVDEDVKTDKIGSSTNEMAAAQPKKELAKKSKNSYVPASKTIQTDREEEAVEILEENSIQIAESSSQRDMIEPESIHEDAAIIVLSDDVNTPEDVVVYNAPEVYADPPAIVYQEDAAYVSSYPAEQSEVVSVPDVMATMALVDSAMVRGFVFDSENEPVFGATIVELNTDNGVMTDFDGQFELPLTTSNSQIQVSYIGFKEIVVTPSLDTINSFVLEHGVELDAVIISEYSTTERDSVFQYLDTDISVYPKDGYEQFYKYLDEQLLYPQSATARQVEGVVQLRFEVDANGTPQNVEVRESVGYGCDEEAVRLLKEGPAWKTKEGQNVTNLSIPFKLKETENKVKKESENKGGN